MLYESPLILDGWDVKSDIEGFLSPMESGVALPAFKQSWQFGQWSMAVKQDLLQRYTVLSTKSGFQGTGTMLLSFVSLGPGVGNWIQKDVTTQSPGIIGNQVNKTLEGRIGNVLKTAPNYSMNPSFCLHWECKGRNFTAVGLNSS